MSLDTVSGCPHLDGFRAEITDKDSRVFVDLLLYRDGEVVQKWGFAEYAEAEYSAARRFWQLLASLARFATLGGDINNVYAIWDNWPDVTVTPALPLFCTEADELYTHTYQLPNGKFLRVYEDETYEELDKMELHEVLQDLVDEPGED
jgi:hypothetical protein